MTQIPEHEKLIGTLKLTGSQQRMLRRKAGLAKPTPAEQKEIAFRNGALSLARVSEVFPDTSKKGQLEDERSYRERAHLRKQKAAEKRTRKANKRKKPIENQVPSESILKQN